MAKGKCCRKIGRVAKSASGGNRREDKSFTRFFFCEGHPPPVCLRCSPGLLRHACGVASCHKSSMPAKPHLGLTQNSSPTTLANGRWAAQNRGVQGQSPGRAAHGAKFPLAAASEIPARRSGRNPLASQTAIRRWRNPRQSRRPPSPPHRGWRTTALCRTVSDNVPTPQTTRGSPSMFVGRHLCVPPRRTG